MAKTVKNETFYLMFVCNQTGVLLIRKELERPQTNSSCLLAKKVRLGLSDLVILEARIMFNSAERILRVSGLDRFPRK